MNTAMMVKQAKRFVKEYTIANMPIDVMEVGSMLDFEVYVVWQCKILNNWKALLATSLDDGMYYEVTYNGGKNEFYLDAYRKDENVVIKAIKTAE